MTAEEKTDYIKLLEKLCKYYRYKREVVGLVGECSLGFFGGLHVATCYGNGNCQRYVPSKELTGKEDE